MRVLAVDLATITGWATTGPFSGTVEFDVRRGESPGMRFLRFRRWLEDRWTGEVDVVVYEIAHHRGGAATACGVGLVTTLLTWCAEHKIEHMGCHTATLKKHATGRGNASKDDMILAAVRRWGVQPADDNEADALALLAWAVDGMPQGGGR